MKSMPTKLKEGCVEPLHTRGTIVINETSECSRQGY